jgi:putative hemolysin
MLVSGIFSAMEIALSSSNRTKVKLLAESGDKKAKRLLKALEEPISFFATTQLYITFITLFSGMYAASSFTDPIVEWAMKRSMPISETAVAPVVFILVTVILTYFTLIFGELIPKRIALRKGISFALATINLLNILSKIVFPFVKLLSLSANSLLKLFRVTDGEDEEKITKEEIRMILKSSNEYGSIDESEHDILSHVLDLSERTVVDACVHRVDVIALPMSTGFDEVIDVFITKKCSRLPIYEESIDNIKGILHIKDILKYMVDNKDTSGFDVKASAA